MLFGCLLSAVWFSYSAEGPRQREIPAVPFAVLLFCKNVDHPVFPRLTVSDSCKTDITSLFYRQNPDIAFSRSGQTRLFSMAFQEGSLSSLMVAKIFIIRASNGAGYFPGFSVLHGIGLNSRNSLPCKPILRKSTENQNTQKGASVVTDPAPPYQNKQPVSQNPFSLRFLLLRQQNIQQNGHHGCGNNAGSTENQLYGLGRIGQDTGVGSHAISHAQGNRHNGKISGA